MQKVESGVALNNKSDYQLEVLTSRLKLADAV